MPNITDNSLFDKFHGFLIIECCQAENQEKSYIDVMRDKKNENDSLFYDLDLSDDDYRDILLAPIDDSKFERAFLSSSLCGEGDKFSRILGFLFKRMREINLYVIALFLGNEKTISQTDNPPKDSLLKFVYFWNFCDKWEMYNNIFIEDPIVTKQKNALKAYFEKLNKTPSSNIIDYYQGMASGYMIAHSFTPFLNILIDAGIDINQIDKKGIFPLQYAQNKEIMKICIEAGATTKGIADKMQQHDGNDIRAKILRESIQEIEQSKKNEQLRISLENASNVKMYEDIIVEQKAQHAKELQEQSIQHAKELQEQRIQHAKELQAQDAKLKRYLQEQEDRKPQVTNSKYSTIVKLYKTTTDQLDDRNHKIIKLENDIHSQSRTIAELKNKNDILQNNGPNQRINLSSSSSGISQNKKHC